MSRIGQVIFTSNLITLRRMRGFTQEEISSLSNISIRKYQRIENSETSPDLEDIYRLAKALEVEVNVLINQADDCFNTMGTNRLRIEADQDPNALEFLNFLDNYFLPTYGVDNSRMINVEKVFKDSIFVDHHLKMAVTNFKLNVYNKKHALDRNGVEKEILIPISETSSDPTILMPHFNRLLHMKEEFFYFDAKVLPGRSNKDPWYVLGHVHRKNENLFAVIIKLKNRWSPVGLPNS